MLVYGLKLNYNKCELLVFSGTASLTFADGSRVPQVATAKYLGCQLNVKANAALELGQREETVDAVGVHVSQS